MSVEVCSLYLGHNTSVACVMAVCSLFRCELHFFYYLFLLEYIIFKHKHNQLLQLIQQRLQLRFSPSAGKRGVNLPNNALVCLQLETHNQSNKQILPTQ